MSYKDISSHAKAAQLIEAKPGAWKEHLADDVTYTLASLQKGVGLFVLAAAVISSGPVPVMVVAMGAGSFLIGSALKGYLRGAAETSANEKAAKEVGRDSGHAKQAGFLKTTAKQLLKPV